MSILEKLSYIVLALVSFLAIASTVLAIYDFIRG